METEIRIDRYQDRRAGTDGTHRHTQTDTDRQRDMDGQIHKEEDRHVQRGRRGQTLTDTHQDVTCKDEDRHTHTDGTKIKKAAWSTSIFPIPPHAHGPRSLIRM
ncbi:hypothetical protein V3C99_012979 [Haemonchus contortus]